MLIRPAVLPILVWIPACFVQSNARNVAAFGFPVASVMSNEPIPSPIRSLSQICDVVMQVLMALVCCVANGPLRIQTLMGMKISFENARYTVSEPPVHPTGVRMAGGRKLVNATTSSLPPDAESCCPRSTVSVVDVNL